MSKTSLSVFFIISFLQTGISNSRISVSFKQEADNIILTCVLAGKETLTQVNWEMMQDSNHTKLGIFRPGYLTYIFPEYSGKIKIIGQQTPMASSELSFQKEALNQSGQICCQFITFPSGNLKQCTDIIQIPGMLISPVEPHEASRKQNLFGQFGALTVGCILSLLCLIIIIYVYRRCCYRRVQVVDLQHVRTEPSTFTGIYTEEAREEHHTLAPSGFDPAKLYAKIKEDLYYGRLWKAYQGRTKIPTQGCLTDTRQIYYQLGQNPLQQRDQEHKSKIPDAMTRTSSESSI